MGYFESDALEMLEVYLLETRQLNGQLSEILLEAERAGRFNESSIHSIFRVMHTIKSSSAMMDINGLSSLAHKLEDLFSYYRENMDKLEHPEPDLFDLLFAASDFIAQELEQMNREDYAPGDTSVLEQMTDDFLGHVSREEEKDSGKGGKTQGEEEGKEELPVIPELFVSKSGTVVNVTLEEGCRMENIRAFMLVRSITGLCTLVETYPENLEKQGESAQYIEGHGVFIRFESGDKEKVLETLRKGLFVAQCRVLADSQPQDTAAAAQKAAPERENTDSREGEFMEVRTERLDYLQNLASELLLQMQVLENELKRNGMEDLESGLGHQISLLVGQIERSVMEMRLVPVSRIVPKLKRALRDICRDQKKEADLVVRCSDVEADKSVVDYVSEALLHILRGQKKCPSPGPAPGLPSALCLSAIIIRFYLYSVHDACPFHIKSSCVLQSAYTRAASNYHHFCIKVASSGNFQEQFIDSFIKTNCYYGFFLLPLADNIFFKVRGCFH